MISAFFVLIALFIYSFSKSPILGIITITMCVAAFIDKVVTSRPRAAPEHPPRTQEDEEEQEDEETDDIFTLEP